MKDLINEVVSVWEAGDGMIAKVVIDGGGADAIEAFKALDSMRQPVRNIETSLILKNGERVLLPFIGSAYMTPDRTGVVSIFSPGQYVNDKEDDYFKKPNNAAVFNADGTLRFQLCLDRGVRIAAFHGGEMPEEFKGLMGVVVQPDLSSPPELLYAIDSDSPLLISTGKRVRW
ncbi:MAG: hypothetical protein V4729_06125 [Pseudomonadota bacterium]